MLKCYAATSVLRASPLNWALCAGGQMSKYGDVAVEATHIAQTGVCPVEAWNTAAEKEFKENAASIKKGCPKTLF